MQDTVSFAVAASGVLICASEAPSISRRGHKGKRVTRVQRTIGSGAATRVAASLMLVAVFSPTPPDPSGAQPVQATASDPDSLLTTWIDSVGGMETYQRFQSATFTVTTVWYDTLTGRLQRTRPRYVWIKKGPHGEESRIERYEAAGLIQQGFDGRRVWAAVNADILPDSAKDTREALYVSRDVFYWFGLPFKLRDDGVLLSYDGVRGRPGAMGAGFERPRRGAPATRYHALRVSFGVNVGEHQDVFSYYFAPNRGFPTEVTYVEEGRTDLNRVVWGETGRFGDIDYPVVTRRDWITTSGKRTKALVISDVVINPDLPQKLFERP